MNNPLVSVVVLTYNQEVTVVQTLEGILGQKRNFQIEIVIAEDASPGDNTRQVCQSYVDQYPDIVRLMPQAPNKGVTKNYIDAIRTCKGKYLCACAGDDWWSDKDKLQIEVDYMEANPDCVVVHTDVDMLMMPQEELVRAKGERRPPEGDVVEALFKYCFVTAPTALYRKECMDRIEIEKFAERGFAMEDYPLWFEMATMGKFHYINRSTVTYRVDNNSISHGNFEKRMRFLDATKKVQDYYLEKLNPRLPFDMTALQNRMCYMECLKFGEYRAAFKYARSMGFSGSMGLALSTYLGAWVCGKVLASNWYKKKKAL